MNGLLIGVEREQLDHQKSRLEEILAKDMVSAPLRNDLQRLLEDIEVRLWELSHSHAEGQSILQHH